MQQSRFWEEKMMAIIREADRDQVSAVAKRYAVSEQTIYAWRKRFGGLVPFFVREWFREVGRLGTRRHVMRLDLDGNRQRSRG